MLTSCMLAAIHLNNKLFRPAEEVREIWPNWKLAHELIAAELPVLEFIP